MGVYARVSTATQKTILAQVRELKAYARRRGWEVVMTGREVASGRSDKRPEREALMNAARRRELDAIAVWRLDRWGRSLSDLTTTLEELRQLGVAFVSLTEAFDMTTPTGRAMAGMLGVFAEFEHEIRSERIRAGIEQARREGKHLGRPLTASLKAPEILRLARENKRRKRPLSHAEIARRVGVSRPTVWRVLKGTAKKKT